MELLLILLLIMRIIYNKIIPFSGCVAFNFYGIIFARHTLSEVVMKHELEHTNQMKRLCKWIPIGGTLFYIIYIFMYLYNFLFKYPFNHNKSYKNIPYEIEARKKAAC